MKKEETEEETRTRRREEEERQRWWERKERGEGGPVERGKWGCKSGGQTHYKFITDFPRRATLLRLRVGFETCYTVNSVPRVVTTGPCPGTRDPGRREY